MSLFKERELTHAEEAVVDRCPLVQTYFDIETAATSPELWIERREEAVHPLRNSLQDKFGGVAAWRMLEIVSYTPIYLQALWDEERLKPLDGDEVTTDLVLIGYEMAAIPDSDEVFKGIGLQILARLEKRKFLNDDLAGDDDTGFAEGHLMGLMIAGVALFSEPKIKEEDC